MSPLRAAGGGAAPSAALPGGKARGPRGLLGPPRGGARGCSAAAAARGPGGRGGAGRAPSASAEPAGHNGRPQRGERRRQQQVHCGRQGQMAAALLFYLFLLPGLAGAFNLDTDNVISRRGEPGSLFGFSLAMHRQLQPQEKRL